MSAETRPSSILANPEALPLRPSTSAGAFGSTLVVAPHPDDESLGCGGTIALLRRAQIPVQVVIVSDGAGSHPRSHRFPGPALAALREREARAALAILGVAGEAIHCLGLPDTAVPAAIGEAGFDKATSTCAALIRACAPQTILAPWRREPHCDHRAAFAIVRTALQAVCDRAAVLEYPIWSWTSDTPADLPSHDEAIGWRLDITSVLALKRAAIGMHHSQTTDLIDDDPTGFRLSAGVLAAFLRPWELYLQSKEL